MFIDIHAHILPGLDDGSRNLEQSMKMLQIANENQISTIIATPHNKANRHNASKRTIQDRICELQKCADKEGYAIRIYEGTEFFYRSELTELLLENKVCTLADSKYVLVEFSPMDDYAYIRDGLYKILTAGYRPIIAHIERYQCIMKNQMLADELIDMGCYVQVNAGSILGKFGFRTKCDVKKLLQNGRVHFIATDAHDDDNRTPEIRKCADKLYKKYEREYIESILFRNAEKILADEYI